MDSLETTNETTAIEQPSEIGTENMQQVENESPAREYSSKQQVVERAKAIAESGDKGDRQELDLLKSLFYKFHNIELQEAHKEYIEAGGDPEQFVPQIDPLEPEFRAAMQTIREHRATIQEEQERIKAQNLKRKLEILERIQQMASTPEEANQTGIAFDIHHRKDSIAGKTQFLPGNVHDNGKPFPIVAMSEHGVCRRLRPGVFPLGTVNLRDIAFQFSPVHSASSSSASR